MINKNTKILIIGLGLIGASYAKRLKEKGYYVGAITRSQETIDYALDNNFIDEGTIEVKKEFVSKFDVVVFGLYPNVLLNWIKSYHDYFKKGAIITDVTGVKGAVVYRIEELFKNDEVEFIASHPMAGREVYGIKNANPNIFNDANFIITPTDKSTKEAVDTIKDLATILEFKNISTLSVEEHDEMIAFLSQLTHCIAVSLMCSKSSKHLVDYTGDSFRDLTRIAKINENMWTELFLLNKKELISQMDLFLKSFTELKLAIEEEDEEKMKEMMRTSTRRRSYFDKPNNNK